MTIAEMRKAIAALVAGLIGWATQIVTSDAAQVTAGEWIGLVTVLAVTAGVYQVPNEPDERGQSTVVWLLAVVAVVLLILILFGGGVRAR